MIRDFDQHRHVTKHVARVIRMAATFTPKRLIKTGFQYSSKQWTYTLPEPQGHGSSL